ncbi:nuclear transport factor 2 family protein [Clostridioides difficile]
MNVYSFWNDTLAQDAVKIRKYFHENAYINWHDTNEHFTLEEFIIANCEYPDKWNGKVERVLEFGNLVITVTHVYAINKPLSFHLSALKMIRLFLLMNIGERMMMCHSGD